MLTYKELLNQLNLMDETQLEREVAAYEEDIDWVNKIKGIGFSKDDYAAELEFNTPLLLVDVEDLLEIELEEEEIDI